MKSADLATVQRMFDCVAPTAAAEMKSRVLAVMRGLSALHRGRGRDVDSLEAAITYIEALPLSKEAP